MRGPACNPYPIQDGSGNWQDNWIRLSGVIPEGAGPANPTIMHLGVNVFIAGTDSQNNGLLVWNEQLQSFDPAIVINTSGYVVGECV